MAALQHNSHQAPQKVTFEAVASRLKTEARNEYDDPGGSRVRAMFRKWMRAHQSCEAFGSAIASRDIEDGQRFDALFAEMVDQVEENIAHGLYVDWGGTGLLFAGAAVVVANLRGLRGRKVPA